MKDVLKSSNVTSTTETVAQETQTKNKAVGVVDLELMRIFKYGVPCDSHILPKSIKNLPEVKNRKNEIMTGYCRVCELVY